MWVSVLSGLDPGLEGSGVDGFPCGFVVGCLWCMEPFLGLNVSIQHWRLNWSGFVSPLRQNKDLFYSIAGRWRENKNLDGKNLD